MKQFHHSVKLDEEKCKGCTNCIKRCPTEAIRVRDGIAIIMEEKCIDCGECIRVCPNNAKYAVEDSLEMLKEFDYNIALPAPSFLAQFNSKYSAEEILNALLKIGFDDVFEVAFAAEGVTVAINSYLKEKRQYYPIISQACPAVMGLIQVRFPLLLKNVVPIDTPMNIAAKMAKDAASREKGLNIENIGAFFISPCPAKITSVRHSLSDNKIFVDGTFSISTIYGHMMHYLKDIKDIKESSEISGVSQKASEIGIGWGRSGGEIKGLESDSVLHVDGIHNVVEFFEQLEKGEILDVDYLECQACVGGCVGGSLTVKNPFLARVILDKFAQKELPTTTTENKGILEDYVQKGYFHQKAEIQPRSIEHLDNDISTAIGKINELENILENLPGLDCGSCGSPSCRALAEDIIRGYAQETDCLFNLRQRVQTLSEEILELAKKNPPAMGKRGKNEKE